MGMVMELVGDVLRAAMALAGGVTDALGRTGSVILVATATIGLVWIAGRTLKL